MDVEGGGGGGHKIGVSSGGGLGENTLTKPSMGPALASVSTRALGAFQALCFLDNSKCCRRSAAATMLLK